MPLNKIYRGKILYVQSNREQGDDIEKVITTTATTKKNIINGSRKKIALQVKDVNAQGEIFSSLSDYGTDRTKEKPYIETLVFSDSMRSSSSTFTRTQSLFLSLSVILVCTVLSFFVFAMLGRTMMMKKYCFIYMRPGDEFLQHLCYVIVV